MMHIGLMLEGQNGLNWPRWQKILQVAEDSGYQSVFRSDHYTNPQPPDLDSLELWVSLTYAASHTKRIEFGPMVTPVTFRHPAMTLRMAAQVDDLSNGRLVLGLGAGWNEREHADFGVPFYDRNTRFEMLEDALEMTTRLFNSDEPVSYEGKHFSLNNVVLLPRPKRPGGPPILIGGGGPKRTLPLTAKYAREWNIVNCRLEVLKEKSARLDELLKAEGRKPSDVQRSVFSTAVFGKTDADLRAKLDERGKTSGELWEQNGITAGTTQEFTERLGQWQEAGVERLLLQWLDLDDIEGLEMIARDVLPHFHIN
jgi:F420-dependent oxidoreductase-like protein